MPDAFGDEPLEDESRLVGTQAELEAQLLQCFEDLHDAGPQLEEVAKVSTPFHPVIDARRGIEVATREPPDDGAVDARRASQDGVPVGSVPILLGEVEALTTQPIANVNINRSLKGVLEIKRTANIEDDSADHRRPRYPN